MIRKNIKFGKLKKVTVLEFGKGDIQVIPATGDDYECVMFRNDSEKPIGTYTNVEGFDSDIFKPQVVMTFTNPDSIDVVIEKLNYAKSLLESRN